MLKRSKATTVCTEWADKDILICDISLVGVTVLEADMNRIRRIATTIGLVLTVAIHPVAGEPRPTATKSSATRDQRDIRLEPSGVTFRIPEVWLEWHRQFGNNLHLTREKLEKVKDGGGEWDTEYAAVVNAAIPFDRCSVHVGSEGWGKDGVSFGDLQMRAYVVPETPEKVATAIAKSALVAAGKYDKRAQADNGRTGNWHRATVKYGLWYGDYGGTAVVDVYARPIGKETAVFAFMYAESRDHADAIADILKSVAPLDGK